MRETSRLSSPRLVSVPIATAFSFFPSFLLCVQSVQLPLRLPSFYALFLSSSQILCLSISRPFPATQRWLVISICRHSRNCWPRRGASRWNRAAEMPERALAKQTRCQLCARLLRFARARVEQHSRWLVCSPTSTPDHSAGFNVPDESRNAK